MKHFLLFFVIGITILGGILFWRFRTTQNDQASTLVKISQTPSASVANDPAKTGVIAANLDTPWAITFGTDNSMLVTERGGRVRFIDNKGNLDATPVAELAQVKEIGEGGLLGITVHPDFTTNQYVYFYYTYSNSGNNTFNRVVRMTYNNKELSNEKIIIDKIPGASNHNGGRIHFGPDKLLYIGTGDAENPSQAQDTNTLGGKILRVTDEGKPASENPFGNAVYSYGHRNVQGLAWDMGGNLWATEHGRSGITSGYDEINRIEKGKNYGWPDIQGDETRVGMQTPIKNSGSATTWAPAGAAFVGKSLFFGGLRGQTLYEAVIENNKITAFKEHYNGEYGRIREVIKGPDGMLYITTSNRDGRGIPAEGDDKVLRINPN